MCARLNTDAIAAEIGNQSWNVQISTEKVTQMLLNLKSGKSAGYDDLSPRILREAYDIFAAPLTHLFTVSIATQKFPTAWKMAMIAPIPKKKNPSLNDFRPISLLSIPSKLLETLVLNSVRQRLLLHYGDYQFGFRPGASTLHANVTIHDFVTRHLDKSSMKGVVMIAMDLSKAFDKLSHESLMRSLIGSSFPRDFLLWLSDFLLNRKQRVLLQGTVSTNVTNVTSGVLQGSVLAPYLFAFHMGTLSPAQPETLLVKYADDVSILIPLSENSDLSSLVLTEIENIKKWSSSHGLQVNEEKTKSLVFTKSEITELKLRSVPNLNSDLKILGVTFENTLKWDKHMENITKCASRRIHALRMLKRIPGATQKDLIPVYQNYILSIIEYNSPLFVGLGSRNELGTSCETLPPHHLRSKLSM